MTDEPRHGTGRFITLEGIEGVGKSSQISTVAQLLEAAGRTVLRTREPGGSPAGDRIRALLLESTDTPPGAETEALLLFAARAEHIADVIRPALRAGTWVICDRFTDATYAYQGGGRGLDEARIRYLEEWIQGELRPDRTILLDAPVETALGRARGRGASDRFERETEAFFERARTVYRRRAEAEPERFCVVDAAAPFDTVRAQITTALRDLA